ncbi:protein-L-isoaspartate O-methyltransferase [Candidatus Pacearchaeota archaeon]|nr:protein-L-isoaspartate O-methyltransferase [Candidatus Pacearchaeota archaeon]
MNKDELLASLKKKGFSAAVIDAFGKVKREDFVPQHLIGYAYEDIALPVMEGSTLSQPSTIALMLNLLNVEDNQKILEIGSGSGYVLALLSKINPNGKIYGIEILKELAIRSRIYLAEEKDVEVLIRDGSQGLKEFAPFDRIIVSASCPEVPRHLLEELREEGILVAAVKQSIFQIKKEKNGETVETEFPGFVFVPLRS